MAQVAAKRGAFDILFVAGLPPLLVLPTEIVRAPLDPLEPSEIGAVFRLLLAHKVGRSLPFDPGRAQEAEFVADVPEFGRCRISLYRQQDSPALVLRPVPAAIPSLENLGVPTGIQPFLHQKRGLILVCGPSAAGKSTTLAAMVEYINQRMIRHIISIENPIEYTHKPNRSIISQRSIPDDTPSYSRALRASLRQVPDVLVVGDVQDSETAAAALGAAESGHLVIAAVHSKDTGDAVRQLRGFFPLEQQKQVSVQMSNVLLAVLVQQLVTVRSDHSRRVLATELMIATSGIRHLIRTNQTHRLNTFMQGGRSIGMYTMEESLAQFANSGMIDYGEALTATADAGLFINFLRKGRQGELQTAGRILMARSAQLTNQPAGAFGLRQSALGTTYRTDLMKSAADHWTGNGMVELTHGMICFRSDPFQPARYIQITDYTIWLGHRSPFLLKNYARVILKAEPDNDRSLLRQEVTTLPPCQVWILVILADGSVYTLPDETEPGLELPLDDRWQTLYFPIPVYLASSEVRAYAVRFSRPDIEVCMREVLFN